MKIAGSNIRTDRIAAEIQRALSQIISAGLRDPRVSKMASIVKVDVTRDLSHAKVYVSVLGSEKKGKETIAGLENASGFLRRQLGSMVDIRSLPQLHFVLDNSIEYGIHISKVLGELNSSRSTDDEE